MNLTKFNIFNLDFEEFINNNDDENNFIFLDPPYYLKKARRQSKYYSNMIKEENMEMKSLLALFCRI